MSRQVDSLCGNDNLQTVGQIREYMPYLVGRLDSIGQLPLHAGKGKDVDSEAHNISQHFTLGYPQGQQSARTHACAHSSEAPVLVPIGIHRSVGYDMSTYTDTHANTEIYPRTHTQAHTRGYAHDHCHVNTKARTHARTRRREHKR